eukprot:NODE_8712_length_654_cov_22.325800_g8087_i0.p1 GENE.NODE_8712_length_654_cov_22.325800_g8087_i0~~NODE_8712_length_654_cov_22.325800_g8087_i0.p1  ORF type:complete len:172 (-),score=6.77 NODE_8712_length_654_cov_22.325800_g8087_i0:81-596(-)
MAPKKAPTELTIAPMGRRLLAWILDLLFIAIVAPLLTILFLQIRIDIRPNSIYLLPLIPMLYRTLFQFILGSSFGQRLMKLRTVHDVSSSVSVISILVREFIKYVCLTILISMIVVPFIVLVFNLLLGMFLVEFLPCFGLYGMKRIYWAAENKTPWDHITSTKVVRIAFSK